MLCEAAAASPGLSLPFKPIELLEQYRQSLQYASLIALGSVGWYIWSEEGVSVQVDSET